MGEKLLTYTLFAELFLHVTNDVIETCGISAAWKLRSVCRTFADNLAHEILNLPTTAFTTYRDSYFFEKSVHRYLAARLHNALDVDPGLIQKIRAMVTWATSQLASTTTEQQRDSVALKVCAGLVQNVGKSNLVHALQCSCTSCWSRWRTWSQQPPDSHDKLVVVAAIGCYGDASHLLSDLSNFSSNPPLNSPRHFLSFYPLKHATQNEDDVLLDISLQYLGRLASEGAPGTEMLMKLTQGYDAPFGMNDAIQGALGHSNTDTLQVLLDFHRKYLSLPHRRAYDRWIYFAIMKVHRAGSEAMKFLSMLLNFRPSGKSLVDKQIVSTACDNGSAAVVQEVVEHASKDINKGSILTLPIFIAVRSRRPVAIEGVIGAGADPKVVADSNMPSVAKKRLTPLELAMHRNDLDIVKALLQHGGGPIPHMSEWTTHRRMFNFLRRTVLQDTGKELPTLKAFNRMTEEERKAIDH